MTTSAATAIATISIYSDASLKMVCAPSSTGDQRHACRLMLMAATEEMLKQDVSPSIFPPEIAALEA